jgi:hypothetical protein
VKWKGYDHTHSCHFSFYFAGTHRMVSFKVLFSSFFCNFIDMIRVGWKMWQEFIAKGGQQ